MNDAVRAKKLGVVPSLTVVIFLVECWQAATLLKERDHWHQAAMKSQNQAGDCFNTQLQPMKT